jgi:hypothetical protein
MSFAVGGVTVMTRQLGLVVTVAMIGCSAATPHHEGVGPDAAVGGGGGGGGGGEGGGGVDGSMQLDDDGDGVTDDVDNCPGVYNKDQTDGDADAYGDACDCDPADAQVAADLVFQNSLASDTGSFAAAPGFAAADWQYATGALRQTRLANNASDATFFKGTDKPLGDVMIDVDGASTAIMEFDTQDLRQMFILARADSAADKFTAVGCGLEVVEGLTPTQKTSAVILGGKPSLTTTTAKQRTNRPAVQVNEQFSMHMDLRGDTMTCTVVQGGTTRTVAKATGLAASTGSVGLFTRETKAGYKNLRICSYRP